jgi:hypothetical protein
MENTQRSKPGGSGCWQSHSQVTKARYNSTLSMTIGKRPHLASRPTCQVCSPMGSPQSSVQSQSHPDRPQPSVTAAPRRHVLDTFFVCRTRANFACYPGKIPASHCPQHRVNNDRLQAKQIVHLDHLLSLDLLRYLQRKKDKTSVHGQEDDATMSIGLLYREAFGPVWCYLSFNHTSTHGSSAFHSISHRLTSFQTWLTTSATPTCRTPTAAML